MGEPTVAQANLMAEMPPACEHHWSSRHVPGLRIWLVTCTICGDPNVADMNQQISDVQHPTRAWARKLREHAEMTSWQRALKGAVRRLVARESRP